MNNPANQITHVALVLDASYSMNHHARTVVKVADEQIAYLARRSQELDQETRVSVYTFADDVRCEIFDKDVLRLPSIAGLYRTRGNTALIDATIRSQDDLATTSQLYGEHAFLTFVLTDGEENASRGSRTSKVARMQAKLAGLPAHWTVACLVPDALGKHEAQTFGFAPGNIAVWDTTTQRGLEEAGTVIQRATDNFMTGRTKGVHNSRTLFSTGVDAVNAATVTSALTPVDRAMYQVFPVRADGYIRALVESLGKDYKIGSGYYQLTKKETIQRTKKIVVREKATGKVYAGDAARDLIGLGGNDVRVAPDHNPAWDIFVQSTSVNRRLIAGTDLLIMR